MTAHGSSATVELRRVASADRSALRALIAHDVAGTPYTDVPTYFLELALSGRASESRAIVAERDGEIMGFALFGEVAGSAGTGRLHFISVTASARLSAVGARLCAAAIDDLAAHGVRMVMAEVPDDPILASGRALLERCGFGEAARVSDYYRDGVALVILTRSTTGITG